jgi:tetratricopeptide (TPR) repeat protein
MPSHIYLRTGDYDKGVAVNEDAIHSYKRTLELYAPVSGADFLYSIHNLHMQTNNAMLAGRQAYSVASAEATRGSIPKDYLMAPGALGNYIQYISMTPLLTDIRFGRWSAILSSAAPANELVYANVIFALGKGLAYTAQSNLPEAKNQLVIIQSLMKDSVLALPFPPFSPALDGATIAYNLLAGSIDLAEKRFEKAAAAFSEAVAIEDNMVYNEPRDWMLSPRHYLGYAYLKSGDFKQAAAVFEADLKYNNDNIWSLQGLYDARVGLKQQAEIPSLKKKLDRLKKASDLTTLQAVYL